MKNSLPFIRRYLKAGAMVSKNYYIDRQFQTIDYCVVMLIDQTANCYHKKFLNQDEH